MEHGTVLEDSFVDDESRIAPISAEGDHITREPKFDRSLVCDRRQTYSGNATTMGDFEASLQEYYTPDTTMSKSNAYFLDKVKAALGECTSAETTFATACDKTLNHSNAVKVGQNRRSSLPRLTDMTLVNNSDTNPLFSIDKTPEKSKISERLEKYVAEEHISDSELDNDFLRYQGTQIKYEDITVDDIDSNDVPSDEEQKQYQYIGDKNQQCEDIDDNDENKYEYFEKCQDADENQSNEYVENQDDDSYEYPQRGQEEYYGSQGNPNKSEENYKETLSSEETSSVYSMQSLENKTIDYNSWQAKSYESSDNLREGSFKQPELKPSAIPRKKFFVTPPKNILRPKNENSASKLPQRRFFQTPTNQQLLTKKKTPSTADKFSYVQSPVSIYIKNSKTSAICRNVHPSKLPEILPSSFFDDVPDISHRWKFEIPQVVYRPSGIQHTLRPREIHLPENIHILMPMVSNMVITKHETRIPGKEINTSSIRRKLNEDVDLTMGCSVLDDGPQDISILQVKPYI